MPFLLVKQYSQTPIKRTPLGPGLGVRLIGVGTVGGVHGVTSSFDRLSLVLL